MSCLSLPAAKRPVTMKWAPSSQPLFVLAFPFKRSRQVTFPFTSSTTATQGRFICPSKSCSSGRRKVLGSTTDLPSADHAALVHTPPHHPAALPIGALVSGFTFPVESSIHTYSLTYPYPPNASVSSWPAP